MLTKEKGATCEIAPQTNPINDYNTYQGIYKLVGEITKLAAIINDTTESNIFVYYYGHIKGLEVHFHDKGWIDGISNDRQIEVSLNPHSCLYNFRKIEELKETLYNMIDPKNYYLLGGV